tara:strand:- start:5200 stop:7770 length:2571 start_codon:yes stop_codon:yes gene_type:complete
LEETLILKIATSQSDRKLQALDNKMKAFEKTAKKAADGTLPKTNKQIKDLGNSAKNASKDVGKLKKTLIGIGKTIAGGAAVMGWFRGFAEADRAGGAVRTLGVNVDELKKKLFEVSVASGNLRSQTELLAASYDVASAGFHSASEISTILAASLDGAVGGMSTMARVSDAATSVMNAYGKSADEVRGLIDGFIQTQNDGKIVVDQYARQIGRLAPIAKAAEIGIEELNAAIATISASGLPVEQTFTGMAMAIQGIMKPTGDAQKIANKFGFEFSAAALESKGFSGVLLDMKEKLHGNKEAMTRMFGSVEAVKAILPLINDDLVTFNKNLDNQKNSAGAAAQAALIMSGTVGQALGRVMDGLGNIVRNLDWVGVAFKGLLSVVNNFIQGFLGLPKWFQIAATSTVALAIAMLALAPVIGGLIAGFGALSGVAATAAAAMGIALAPILLIAAKIALLVAGLAALWAAFKKFKDLKNWDSKGFAESLIEEGSAEKVAKELKKVEKEIAIWQQRADNEAKGKKNFWYGADPEKLEKLKALQADLKAGLVDIERVQGKINKGKEVETEGSKKIGEEIKKMFEFKTQEQLAGEKLWEQLVKEDKMLEAKKKGTEELQKLERQITVEKLLQAGYTKEQIDALLNNIDTNKKAVTQAEKLKEMWKSIGDTIKSGVVDAIKGAITGAKSFGDVMSSVLSSIADKFLNMAIDNLFSSLGKGGGFFGKLFGAAEGGLARGGIKSGAFADGGVATGPTLGLVGEAGEDEYIIPSSKMEGAMQRYNAGNRGQSVIPGGGTVDSGSGVPGGSVQVDYTGPILSFNSEDYLPRSAVPEIINNAARKGATAGQSKVFSQLKNSRSQRSRIGL